MRDSTPDESSKNQAETTSVVHECVQILEEASSEADGHLRVLQLPLFPGQQLQHLRRHFLPCWTFKLFRKLDHRLSILFTVPRGLTDHVPALINCNPAPLIFSLVILHWWTSRNHSDKMLNHGITHDDRRMARVRARFVIPFFRGILRKDLEACLADRESVPIEEFVDYFNHMNNRRGCEALDFRGVKPPAFFEALTDVCRVDPEYTRLYPVSKGPQGSLASNERKPRQSSRSQPPSAEASLPRPSHVSSHSTSPVISPRRHSVPSSPTSKTDQSSPRILPSGPTTSDLLDPRRNLTIAEVQRILVSFTHGLSDKRLTWECYWNNLKEHDLAVSERFSVLRKTDSDRIDFIEKQVSGVKNSIEVTKCDSIMTVAISKCSCCRSSSLSPVPLSVASEGDDGRDFSESLGRFRNIKLPLNTSLGVDVTEVDFIPRRLRLRFVWRNERFEELHAELQSQYQNNHSTIDDIRVGLICAVPLDGTKDYHRGIVKDISHPALPVVFYIDLGIEVKVARGCIRRLYENLLAVPTFCLAADVCNSPLFEERILLAKKLRKKERVLLCADEYDEVRGRYLVRLETDSGFMSDSGRD